MLTHLHFRIYDSEVAPVATAALEPQPDMDASMGTSVIEADNMMEIIGSPNRLGLLSFVGPATDDKQSVPLTSSPGIRVLEEPSLYSDEVEDNSLKAHEVEDAPANRNAVMSDNARLPDALKVENPLAMEDNRTFREDDDRSVRDEDCVRTMQPMLSLVHMSPQY